ncbi:unnamed protein product [Trichogramma brassicae]|uniref:Uncharacterized protein n=1 Tax=Trichogramma brassicae TaxID=86971 RepID=A0A6H5JAH8_9HYME|nr:unnamed protein product [Trichogramma brassicae]
MSAEDIRIENNDNDFDDEQEFQEFQKDAFVFSPAARAEPVAHAKSLTIFLANSAHRETRRRSKLHYQARSYITLSTTGILRIIKEGVPPDSALGYYFLTTNKNLPK